MLSVRKNLKQKLILDTMASAINVVFSQDGTNIKDDIVKRLKDGSDGIETVRTCYLEDCLGPSNTRQSTDVNILILTPFMCSELVKNKDNDFKVLFPNVEKSLLLVCDRNSEKGATGILSKSLDYSKMYQLHSDNNKEWTYMMIPTIKMMALEQMETRTPDINRYVIRPKQIDSVSFSQCK